MDSASAIRSALVFLDSKKSLHPYGVPRTFLKTEISKLACCAFIGDLRGENIKLLNSAIEKGLRLDSSSVQQIDTAGALIDLRHLSELNSTVVIFLGDCLDPSLKNRLENSESFGKGRYTLDGRQVFLTRALSDVAQSPEVKKQFWHDLKGVMNILAAK